MQPPQDWQPPRDAQPPRNWPPQDFVPDDAYDQQAPRPASPRRGRLRRPPFPTYSRTTRSGTRVTVGGCCLPLPIGCLATVLTVSGAVVVRAIRHGSGG